MSIAYEYINESFNYFSDLAAETGPAATSLAVIVGTSAAAIGSAVGVFLGLQVAEEFTIKSLGLRSRPDHLPSKSTHIDPPNLPFRNEALPTIKEVDEADLNDIPDTDWHLNLHIEPNSEPMADITNRWTDLLTNELESDHYRMNHAFETFNLSAPVMHQFIQVLAKAAPTLDAESRISIISPAQNGYFSEAIEQLQEQIEADAIPQEKLQPIIKQVIHLAEHRNFRNISNFIARAERDSRPLNSSEKEMIKLWATQLVDLYQQYSDAGGAELTNTTDFTPFKVRLNCSDQALDRLVHAFRETIKHNPKEGPAVKVDEQLANPRLDEWQSRFRSVIKSWADPYEFDLCTRH